MTKIRAAVNDNINLIEKKFGIMNDLIMARNCIGTVYGAPKRLINEISINIKMKVNQSIESIERMFNELRDLIENHNPKIQAYVKSK